MAKDDKTVTEAIEPEAAPVAAPADPAQEQPEAAAPVTAEPTPDPSLVEMHKDGVTLFVHRNCQIAHQDAGWRLVVR